MPKKALALLLMLLIPLVVVSLPQIQAQSTMNIGVLAHEITPSEAQALANSNITWVSSDVTVGNSSTNWSNIYNLAKQYNLNLIGILDSVTMSNQAFNLQDWNQTVLSDVSRYGDTVKVWEIWNEPTFARSILGYQNGSASNYTDMLRVAYQDIKNYSSSEIVLGLGGLPLYLGGDIASLNQNFSWAQQVANLGGMQYCDEIALHAYPYQPYNSIVENAFKNSLATYRNITGKDVWITEVGLQSLDTPDNLTQNDQVYFLNQSYQLFQQQKTKAYIWYELNDNTSRTGDPHGFGLFENNANAKTTFNAFTNLATDSSHITQAKNFIVRNYNPSIGLVCESPDNGLNNNYWICSDNFLVQLVLSPYATRDVAVSQILQNITATSSYWLNNQPIINQYNALTTSIENLPFNASANYIISHFGIATIKSTFNNQTGTLDPAKYADIAFLEAIAYQNAGQHQNAIIAYNDGTATWDGIGFKDTTYNSSVGYDTYKDALYILASEVLGQSFYLDAYTNLVSCQLTSGVSGFADAGGFATYYTTNGLTNNQTNTETTALAILALNNQPITQSPSKTIETTPTPVIPEFVFWIIVPMFIAVLLCTVLLRKHTKLTPVK